MYYDCVVVGAGASGLMFAARLDLVSLGRRGVILEKTASIGTKLLMSGGGRCNITHGGSIKEFVTAYHGAGSKLRKCLYRHNNIELAGWLESNGINLADEDGHPVNSHELGSAGRIFPASMEASDILALLTEKSMSNGWEVRTRSEVTDIRQLEDKPNGANTWLVRTSSEEFRAPHVVIATGGITLPKTGSDGSINPVLRRLGITITTQRSALAPVYVRDYPYTDLSGISIQDVTVTAFPPDNGLAADSDTASMHSAGRGKACRMTGDMLFTHKGFSGPVILNISRYLDPGSTICISYNKPYEELPRRMQKALAARAKGPSGDVRTRKLASLLASDEFCVSRVDDNGMVTAGGIGLEQIDMSSMEVMPGLHAIGEAIDADGITGGYNLQMCWSTACTAADAIQHI